ncbi:hypothetical protein PFISCL1PPCAC_14972, partial [Pristionchus fissidentatus]
LKMSTESLSGSSRDSSRCPEDEVVTWLSSEIPPHTFSVEASDLPTKTVVVYADRAEVKRVVTTRLPKGTNEIIIQNVSNVIERQSVRVDAQGVLIQEVQYQEIPLDTVTETEKVRALEKEQAEMEMNRASIDDEITSLRKRIEVMDGVAAQIASGPPSPTSPFTQPPPLGTHARRASLSCIVPPPPQLSPSSSSLGFLVNDDALGNLIKFLTYYGDSVGQMRKEVRQKQKEGERLSEAIEMLERRISQLRCGYEYDSVKRNISIIVESDCERDVELFVTYQVYCASWKPTYDIRASTAAETDQPSMVTLCYYGLVEQNTGDSWKDCELILSTATPSLAGCAPPLPTLAASLHKTNYPRQRHGSSRRKQPMSAASEEDMGFGSFDYNEMVDAAAMHRLNLHSSEENSTASPMRVLDNLACTCFSVPRAVTVPSNGIEHKVLVAQVDLACAFFHETVPSKCSSAFLSALVTNTSSLPILPAAASVYVNNSFVSKTMLPGVAPGEEFRCTLGVDPAVKVEYKTPLRAHEQVGFVSKSTLLTHEQMISLRNAKVGNAVQITVREQIPKAVDDKIKVNLLSPEVKKGGEARLNRDNNLEWTTVLAPGQQKDLLIKYTVEYPVNETVAYRTMHG